MRILSIAGLAMVTAIAATPATAQRAMSNGQAWQNGRSMPPATVSPTPPGFNGPPAAWNQSGPAHYNPPPAVPGNPPRINGSPAQMPNPRHHDGPQNGGQWTGGGQWSGGGQTMGPRPGHGPIQSGSRPQHWGGSIGGRWHGGSDAPGGWGAYHRPSRGWKLPRYWIAPSFYIGNFGLYGLSTPPQGYSWTRYYDDAILLDSRGRVWDSVSGIDWDSYDDGYGYADGGDGYAAPGDGGGYDGGGYGAGYAPPSDYAPPPPSYGQPPVVQHGYSGSGYVTTSGYASGGYWYPPVTTTTITVQSAPVVTTTTTEYVEETTNYTAARRIYHAPKRKWRSKLHRSCTCGCGCR